MCWMCFCELMGFVFLCRLVRILWILVILGFVLVWVVMWCELGLLNVDRLGLCS